LTGIAANSNTNLVQLANEFVNLTFWGPLLREFRAGQRPSIFGEGPGSKVFEQQLDMELIRRMSRRSSSGLSGSLLRQLAGRGNKQAVLNTLNAEASSDGAAGYRIAAEGKIYPKGIILSGRGQ